jgi:hypothetical protein
MKQVFSSLESVEVGLRESVLKAAGIACETRGNPMSQVANPTELWIIHDHDHREANRLLAEPNSEEGIRQHASLGSVPGMRRSKPGPFYRFGEFCVFLLDLTVLGWILWEIYEWIKGAP